MSGRSARRTDLVMGVLWDTVDLFLAGDPHAQRRLGELDDLLAARKHLAAGFVADALKVMLAIRAGRFREAEQGAQACAELGQAAGDLTRSAGTARSWWRSGGSRAGSASWCRCWTGDALPHAQRDRQFGRRGAGGGGGRGGRPPDGGGRLARLCGDDLGALPRSSTWLISLCGVAVR